MATQFLRWESGQTCGAIVYDPRNPHEGQLIATTDGENWVAYRKELPVRNPLEGQLYRVTFANAPPEYRLLVEWARETVKNWGQLYTTRAGKFIKSTVIEYSSPLTKHLGSVEYTGFEQVEKRSAHTLEAVHRAVNASAARAIEVWGWNCTGLEVKFHETGRAFGLAYEPGTGKQKGVRKISLNVQLLQLYDLNSVARVVVHELCHHYREETWPRRRAGSDGHDSRFCEELGRADPEVQASIPPPFRPGPEHEVAYLEWKKRNEGAANRCTYFADIPDTALQAAHKAKTRRVVEPTWAPEAGALKFYRLKSGVLRMSWEPRPGFHWTTEKQPVNDSSMLALAKRFGPKDWGRVLVHVEERYAVQARLPVETTLDNLLAYLIQRFGLKKTGAYKAEAEAV